MSGRRDMGRALGIVSNQIKRHFDEYEAGSGITGVQSRLLHFILLQSEERDLFQKDLEDEFNLRRSTATGILQLMEKNGLLRRESVDYDARLKKIIVTDKGCEMRQKAKESIDALEAKLCRDLSQEDIEIFFRIMEQMSKNLD